MSAIAFEAAVHELAHAIPGVNATKYLSAAGLVVLLYDHLLLLDAEIRLIWAAQRSWSKTLFLINKYLVPAFLILSAHALSGISTTGLSTLTWLPVSAFVGITSLGVVNVFVVQRVWALWGRNTTILKFLIVAFITVYLATYTASAVIFFRLIPDLGYSPQLGTCVVLTKPRSLIIMYAVPLALDVLVFALTCWNAFDRPRHLQAAITKQLITDGVIYFVCLMTLRLFNILIIAVADTSYTQLGVYFLWAMITAIINRMLIKSGIVEVHPGPDPSGRQTPFKMRDGSGSFYGTDPYDAYNDEDELTEVYPFESFGEVEGMPYKAQVV